MHSVTKNKLIWGGGGVGAGWRRGSILLLSKYLHHGVCASIYNDDYGSHAACVPQQKYYVQQGRNNMYRLAEGTQTEGRR